MRPQIAEARLLKRFERLFGSGRETIVAVGGWVISGQHRRFEEPVESKGLRTTFRKAGYSVYLLEEFRVCTNPRPHRSGSVLVASRAGPVNDLLQAVEPR
ncbi:hypothetical protein Gpo141_00005353 [Globisporangium polare]